MGSVDITSNMETVLAMAGLGLAVPGVIDLSIKSGRYIVEKIDDFKEAPSAIKDLREFGVGLVSGQLKMNLENGAVAIDDPNVDDSLKANLNKCIIKLQTNLIKADRLLNRYLESDGSCDRFAYVFGGKSAIQKVVRGLRKQEKEFSSLINNIHIHREMVPPVLLLSPAQFKIVGGEDSPTPPGFALPNSKIFIAQGSLKNCEAGRDISGIGNFILEGRKYDREPSDKVHEDIQNLAAKLIKAEPRSGIPKLVGYRNAHCRLSYELIFSVPPYNDRPRSLHDLLLDSTVKIPSLTYRLNICNQLAKAVLYTHNLKLVHKNIRPENIILIAPKGIAGGQPGCQHLSTLLLTNWELVRKLGEATSLVGSDDWKRGIYQHPKRQGVRPEDEYCMGHDIYSLGICMLEIFLWETFVKENGQISQTYQERAIGLELVDEKYKGETSRMVKRPTVVQKVFVDLAKTELPAAVGDTMAQLVVNCLTCLEDGFGGSGGFGDRASVVETGLKYIQEVLSVFSNCSAI